MYSEQNAKSFKYKCQTLLGQMPTAIGNKSEEYRLKVNSICSTQWLIQTKKISKVINIINKTFIQTFKGI